MCLLCTSSCLDIPASIRCPLSMVLNPNICRPSIMKEKPEEIEMSSNETETTKKKERRKPGVFEELKGDRLHVCILFFLYILQGIPLGLIEAIPLVLSNRNIPYKEQAKFSFSSYPFSMKLLWAPLVDSVYSTKFGRRKSWLVPVQYLIGNVFSNSVPLTQHYLHTLRRHHVTSKIC